MLSLWKRKKPLQPAEPRSGPSPPSELSSDSDSAAQRPEAPATTGRRLNGRDATAHSKTVASLAKRIGDSIGPLVDNAIRNGLGRVDEHVRSAAAASDERLAAVAKQIADGIVHRLDRQEQKLTNALTERLDQLTESLVATVAEKLKAQGATTTAEVKEACSMATLRASQKPTIDHLIALLDRICDERSFLGAAFRKDPELTAHLGCRHLHERSDEALGSFVREEMMILATLGIEPLQGPAGRFNPKLQKVVGVDPTSDPQRDGQVSKIVRAGFVWHGSVLRPEQVSVFKMEK